MSLLLSIAMVIFFLIIGKARGVDAQTVYMVCAILLAGGLAGLND